MGDDDKYLNILPKDIKDSFILTNGSACLVISLEKK